MTCTPSGRPPWSLYERWRMPFPTPCTGIDAWEAGRASNGKAVSVARPARLRRCSRRVMVVIVPPDFTIGCSVGVMCGYCRAGGRWLQMTHGYRMRRGVWVWLAVGARSAWVGDRASWSPPRGSVRTCLSEWGVLPAQELQHRPRRLISTFAPPSRPFPRRQRLPGLRCGRR